MLFLISSSPDTTEFKTAFETARSMKAEICLLQNAVYAACEIKDTPLNVLSDDIKLRGISPDIINANIIDYEQLVDMMERSDRVVGLF